jgi:hypothetical protein
MVHKDRANAGTTLQINGVLAAPANALAPHDSYSFDSELFNLIWAPSQPRDRASAGTTLQMVHKDFRRPWTVFVYQPTALVHMRSAPLPISKVQVRVKFVHSKVPQPSAL